MEQPSPGVTLCFCSSSSLSCNFYNFTKYLTFSSSALTIAVLFQPILDLNTFTWCFLGGIMMDVRCVQESHLNMFLFEFDRGTQDQVSFVTLLYFVFLSIVNVIEVN